MINNKNEENNIYQEENLKFKRNIISRIIHKTDKTSLGALYALIYALGFLLIIQIMAINGVFHTCVMSERVVSEKTCLVDGVIEKYCEKCEFVEKKVTPAEGHEWVTTTIKEYTCTENGMVEDKCSVCGQTQSRTVYASHTFKDNECRKCGIVKSTLTPDTWYTLTEDKAFYCQNAVIRNAVPMSKGLVYMVTYFPACKECNICGNMRMLGIRYDTPATETYYCNECGVLTYARFKIEY